MANAKSIFELGFHTLHLFRWVELTCNKRVIKLLSHKKNWQSQPIGNRYSWTKKNRRTSRFKNWVSAPRPRHFHIIHSHLIGCFTLHCTTRYTYIHTLRRSISYLSVCVQHKLRFDGEWNDEVIRVLERRKRKIWKYPTRRSTLHGTFDSCVNRNRLEPFFVALVTRCNRFESTPLCFERFGFKPTAGEPFAYAATGQNLNLKFRHPSLALLSLYYSRLE